VPWLEQFAFTHRGLTGHVEADVVANDDPAKFGCNDDNLGFPVCTAEVRYSGGGYQAMFGWVQLVRSTDATTPDFEMDPTFLFPDVDVPYCYHGYKPTLFDSPGRTHRDDMEWVAHSFLAASPIEPGARQVTPLQGFSWGFTRRGTISLAPVLPLAPNGWISHIPYLQRAYPNWQFDPGPRWSQRERGRLGRECRGCCGVFVLRVLLPDWAVLRRCSPRHSSLT
jgi:hypothetical protein